MSASSSIPTPWVNGAARTLHETLPAFDARYASKQGSAASQGALPTQPICGSLEQFGAKATAVHTEICVPVVGGVRGPVSDFSEPSFSILVLNLLLASRSNSGPPLLCSPFETIGSLRWTWNHMATPFHMDGPQPRLGGPLLKCFSRRCCPCMLCYAIQNSERNQISPSQGRLCLHESLPHRPLLFQSLI